MEQKSENLIKNACYSKQMIIFANRITSVLCWCRNMRQKALRSFPNRYLFSLCHKVTSSFSIRYNLRIIFVCVWKFIFNRMKLEFQPYETWVSTAWNSNSNRMKLEFQPHETLFQCDFSHIATRYQLFWRAISVILHANVAEIAS